MKLLKPRGEFSHCCILALHAGFCVMDSPVFQTFTYVPFGAGTAIFHNDFRYYNLVRDISYDY